jgi:glutamate/aspartate transport system substrate-binding protein
MNEERVLKINIIESKDHGESFKAVDEGRAVAFPMDDVLLYGLISRAKKPDDFAVVGKYLSVEPYAIMLRRDEPQFERIVNRALIDLFQSGEIRRIYARWFNTKDLTVPLNPYLKEAFAAPNTYPAWP